jgi:hypothetical protein
MNLPCVVDLSWIHAGLGSVGTAIATILDGNDDDKEVKDDNDDDDDDDYEDDDLHLVIPPDRGRVECWIDRLYARPSPIRGTPLLSRRLPGGDDRGSARSVSSCVAFVLVEKTCLVGSVC